jgi:hypothetical protein
MTIPTEPMQLAESPRGSKSHVTTNTAYTWCSTVITSQWTLTEYHSPDDVTCTWCKVAAHNAENRRVIVLDEAVDKAFPDTEAGADQIDRQAAEAVARDKSLDEVIQSSKWEIPTTEGEYTHAHFVQATDPSFEERPFNLMDLSGDDIRTIYYAIREYKDNVLKDLTARGGTTTEHADDKFGAEDELFLSEYITKLARWQMDLEHHFGGVDKLSFG